MVEDGHVTEGTSNNAYIVKGNTIVTRHLGTEILHGITRAAVLRLPARRRCRSRSGPSPSTRRRRPMRRSSPRPPAFVMPVVEIDGATIGEGTPGAVTARLREVYLDEMRKAAV
jgi:D-alanine transaminase